MSLSLSPAANCTTSDATNPSTGIDQHDYWQGMTEAKKDKLKETKQELEAHLKASNQKSKSGRFFNVEGGLRTGIKNALPAKRAHRK